MTVSERWGKTARKLTTHIYKYDYFNFQPVSKVLWNVEYVWRIYLLQYFFIYLCINVAKICKSLSIIRENTWSFHGLNKFIRKRSSWQLWLHKMMKPILVTCPTTRRPGLTFSLLINLFDFFTSFSHPCVLWTLICMSSLCLF